ncbi:aminotransferase class I/II-fold pyridoxal phosphate-dependent enzyme [Mycetocola sp. 2940]|uniref:aminotransferase class I/II-fold pyridoxal phosphate-dependent enzyme n=1 Tax=Mycetocola sp. 2940 TaxID=3156452 RepID=UPI0033918682
MNSITDPHTLPRPRAGIARIPVYSAALPGATPVLFRASSNEAATAPSAAVVAAVTTATQAGNRYPALHGADLIASLAASVGQPVGRIAVGDGSLSLLNYLLLAFLEPGHRVVYAWRSYEAYPICVLTCGGEPAAVPLAADFGHDLDAMAAAIDDTTDVVILCNPNNPTGMAFGADALADFLARVPSHVLVVLDEAYRDFTGPDLAFEATGFLEQHPNLVLLRTFSKAYALAGLRVGYLVASDAIVAAVSAVLPPFPVAAAGVAAAVTSLGEPEVRDDLVHAVLAGREAMTEVLVSAGLPVVPGNGNFLWIPLGPASAELAGRLREAGITVRLFAGEGVRITVGEPGLAEAVGRALAIAETGA